MPLLSRLRSEPVHPEEVRGRYEHLPYLAETGLAAQRMPLGARLGKIGCADMGRHGGPFRRC
jgi:hypothetical protein